MRRLKLRTWKTAAVLVVASAAFTVWATGSLAASHAKIVKVAIMTDCKGAFAFGYDFDIGGAQGAFARFAGGVTKSHAKPSAGMTGIHIGNTQIKIVGYGCGNDTVPLAISETKRLMEQLNADVEIGPLSGDEAVATANYAKTHPSKVFIIGTAGSQDPTMQIHPKNMFRYHGDGAQWNAGVGELAYRVLHWRKAAIIEDDYSFGWTSAAGMIADFCAVGGDIVKRVFPPLNTTDYSSWVRQLPAPNTVDGYFSTVGGTGTAAMLKAYEQAYGKLDPKKWVGNLFFGFLGAEKTVAPKLVGAYVGGFNNAPGVHTPKSDAYRAFMTKLYPKIPPDDGFTVNYYNAAHALIVGLQASGGAVGPALVKALPRELDEPFQISNGGKAKLDVRNQVISDQYQLQLVKNKDGSVGPTVVAYVPGVDQSFGGLFKPTSPPPGRTQPPCKKVKTPWQGKIQKVVNGKITNQFIK